MADDLTPLKLHVNAIRDALNPPATTSDRNRVDIMLGELGPHTWGCPRRILFEPTGGEVKPPMATGKIEVAPLKWARPARAAAVQIRAHIVAESHAALWLLWSNLMIASDELGSFSEDGSFELNPDNKTVASSLGDNARVMTQDFVWNFHLFDRIMVLPPYGQDVDLVRTGTLVPADAFTSAQDFLEFGEPDP